MGLKWVGKWKVAPGGSLPPEPVSYIVGVPCRDLTDEEAAECEGGAEALLASLLWERESGKPPKRSAHAGEEVSDGNGS